MAGSFQGIGLIKNSIHPQILRTSRKIYREAFEVMVTTNRFVRIRATAGVPLLDLIGREGIPILTKNPAQIDRFRGCALSLKLVKKYKPRRTLTYDDNDEHDYGFRPPGPAEFIILGRDMKQFCKGFANSNMAPPGSNNLLVHVFLAPVLREYPAWNSRSLEAYFHGEQQSLLRPLVQNLRGLHELKVRGVVSANVAADAQAAMARSRTREEMIIYRAAFANKRGNSFFEKQNYTQACRVWRDAIAGIEYLRRSDDWANLLKDGIDNVVIPLAELYYVMHLNIAHAELQRYIVQSILPYSSMAFAKRALYKAKRSTDDDFWGDRLSWNPEPYQKAALLCKTATYLRLEGLELDEAMSHLRAALRLCPGDNEVLWEQREIARLQEESAS